MGCWEKGGTWIDLTYRRHPRYLDLGEGEGEDLGEQGEEDDGPAVAVRHMQAVQAGLDVGEDVVQGIHYGVEPPIVCLSHLLRRPI